MKSRQAYYHAEKKKFLQQRFAKRIGFTKWLPYVLEAEPELVTVELVQALRQASLELLRSERYRHPFYGAGFVMIGDGW